MKFAYLVSNKNWRIYVLPRNKKINGNHIYLNEGAILSTFGMVVKYQFSRLFKGGSK